MLQMNPAYAMIKSCIQWGNNGLTLLYLCSMYFNAAIEKDVAVYKEI